MVGDELITGPGSFALVTFLDGTTLTVSALSDITITEVQAKAQGTGFDIGVFLNLGTIWGRVARLFDPGSTVRIESHTATATSNFGLPGARVNPDESFDCWTMQGEMTYKLADDDREWTLQAGRFTHIGLDPTEERRSTAFGHASVLRIVARGAFPLLQMPEDPRILGFVSPGIDVNQAWPSVTSSSRGAHMVEVGAGFAGRFLLVLEGEQDGPFEVRVTGFFRDEPVFEELLQGTIAEGERLFSEIRHDLDPPRPTALPDRFAATILGGSVAPLEPFIGPLPGTIVISPLQLQAISGRNPGP